MLANFMNGYDEYGQEASRRKQHYEASPMCHLKLSSTSSSFQSVPKAALQMERRWSPYINNGGTVLCVSGDDFAVAVGDTRLSLGYSIQSRQQSKIVKLTDRCVIATSGMQADMLTLHKLLKIRIERYQHQHRQPPSVTAIAQLLSTMLYSRRFFPFYTFNIICGIDDEGKGAVYGYDAIGSFERSKYNCSGTGGSLMMSLLDNQIGKTNQKYPPSDPNRMQIIDLVKDAITSAAERDIFTGDQAELVVIDSSGIKTEVLELRKD